MYKGRFRETCYFINQRFKNEMGRVKLFYIESETTHTGQESSVEECMSAEREVSGVTPSSDGPKVEAYSIIHVY